MGNNSWLEIEGENDFNYFHVRYSIYLVGGGSATGNCGQVQRGAECILGLTDHLLFRLQWK